MRLCLWRPLLLLVVAASGFLGAAWAADTDEPFDPSVCRPGVTVRADNDIDQNFEQGDPTAAEPVPAAVRDKLVDLATDLAIRAGDVRMAGMTCDKMMPKTFKVAVTSRLDLYVAFLRDVYGYRYVLIVHDREGDRISPRPIQFGARALRGSPPLEKPYVSFIDLRQDGRRQIVFQEPTHFFEIYLGVIYHYFDVGPDLELTHIMARETRFRDRMYRGAGFHRDITLLEPGRIRLETSLIPDGQPPRPLGYVELESKGLGAAFKVVRRRALTPEFYSDLVTIDARNPDFAIQEAAEEKFLRGE